MWLKAILLGLALALLGGTSASARSSGLGHDDPWDPNHLDTLPMEVRQYVKHVCKGPPRARHEFATYSPLEKRWRINLEYLHCEGLGTFRRGDDCLDVDFVAVGSLYKLARRSYSSCGF